MREEIVEKDLVYAINACVFEVYRHHGHGFLEKVYENALVRELQSRGIAVEAQILNYLKATGEKVGLLVNFSHPKATIKRFVL